MRAIGGTGGLSATVAALGAVLALALPAPAPALGSAAADEGPATAERSARESAQPLARYWTAERMRSARPLELVRSGGELEARLARNHPLPYTSFPVASPTVGPYASNGKLFGELRNVGRFECSATVVEAFNQRVIFTAGHCLYDHESGRFARRLLFVPAYSAGLAPYGKWPWLELETTREWVRKANSNFDYGAVLLKKAASGATVEGVVGGIPVLASPPRDQHYSAYGYPGNLGEAQVMWSCSSDYGGDDPRPFRGGLPPMAIGCNMGSGASGGGWITDTGGLASVSSFGYRRHPNVLYGPYLTAKATRIVARLGAP